MAKVKKAIGNVNQTLSPKQELFCQEYIVDLNAAGAAVRAGYSNKTSAVIAYQHLTKLHIQRRIGELQEKRAKRTEITQDAVISELAKLAFANVADYVNGDNRVLEIKHLDRDKTAALKSIKTTVKTDKDGLVTFDTDLGIHDKKSPLELLGRHLGMFKGEFKIDVITEDGPDFSKLSDQEVIQWMVLNKKLRK